MKSLIQRVSEASVTVDGRIVGAISRGLLVFVGVENGDNATTVTRMVERLINYRVFPDRAGRMNKSVKDAKGAMLLVSQFTLVADTRKGTRPSFSSAGEPAVAEKVFDALVEEATARHSPVATGVFGADMQVALVNDGPVTFIIES